MLAVSGHRDLASPQVVMWGNYGGRAAGLQRPVVLAWDAAAKPSSARRSICARAGPPLQSLGGHLRARPAVLAPRYLPVGVGCGAGLEPEPVLGIAPWPSTGRQLGAPPAVVPSLA
ncbi:hypothetical protein Tter_2498 [Thermobaculum terrenum ATCC BAA-798]|uniref:Uncharacterized protein n=1 Tax=Thermobaculum terrenum (strain ATCC BAA-798 / CCMEE 7001 / YNP1) TaxID=525904 RepID=D1CI16_THET1|nr:hypothetical protein [Thermobaculum terrenum]ACZ43387.1 hypothetical protein Tter_2498 [Thermobaculum terrenum ATCC BAA-798]